MARENRTKRDERRFGKPERLADKLILSELPTKSPNAWTIPGFWEFMPYRDVLAHLDLLLVQCQLLIEKSYIVDMNNVASYYYEVNGLEHWDYLTAFPNCRPSFEYIFLETKRPDFCRIGTKIERFDAGFPHQWGVLVESLDASQLPRGGQIDLITTNLVPLLDLNGISSILRLSLIMIREGGIMLPVGSYYVPINNDGKILAIPVTMFNGPNSQKEAIDAHSRSAGQFFQTALLAISFMNCKNVNTASVEPNRDHNRERKKVGLKPFLRYHTINIDPMKRVLKTEGNIEANGLQRALHICRGHFATYTEEKPLFGHSVGRFWIPAHIRGTPDKGIVVSDYRVNPPKDEP